MRIFDEFQFQCLTTKIFYLKNPFEEDDIEGDESNEDDDHADDHRDILSAVHLGALTPSKWSEASSQHIC